jgi:hypothetical protein
MRAPETVTGAGGLNPIRFQIQTDSIQVQIVSSFDRFKNGLTELLHFEIKYDFEYLEKTNNFIHRKSFKFERDFE